MRAGYLTESEADLREVTVPASPDTLTDAASIAGQTITTRLNIPAPDADDRDAG